MEDYRKTIDLGLIVDGEWRRRVFLDVSVRPFWGNRMTFFASAYTYAERKDGFLGDCIEGGQCFKELEQHIKYDREFKLVNYLWKKYHMKNIPKFWFFILRVFIFNRRKR